VKKYHNCLLPHWIWNTIFHFTISRYLNLPKNHQVNIRKNWVPCLLRTRHFCQFIVDTFIHFHTLLSSQEECGCSAALGALEAPHAFMFIVGLILATVTRTHESTVPVVPKLLPAVTQIKVAIMFLLLSSNSAMIAHNTEQHCGFGSVLPPEESHITPQGNLSPVWEPLHYTNVLFKMSNCANVQNHQISCAVKSHSRALATFRNIGKARKQEAIWMKCVLCSYFDNILHLL